MPLSSDQLALLESFFDNTEKDWGVYFKIILEDPIDIGTKILFLERALYDSSYKLCFKQPSSMQKNTLYISKDQRSYTTITPAGQEISAKITYSNPNVVLPLKVKEFIKYMPDLFIMAFNRGHVSKSFNDSLDELQSSALEKVSARQDLIIALKTLHDLYFNKSVLNDKRQTVSAFQYYFKDMGCEAPNDIPAVQTFLREKVLSCIEQLRKNQPRDIVKEDAQKALRIIREGRKEPDLSWRQSLPLQQRARQSSNRYRMLAVVPGDKIMGFVSSLPAEITIAENFPNLTLPNTFNLVLASKTEYRFKEFANTKGLPYTCYPSVLGLLRRNLMPRTEFIDLTEIQCALIDNPLIFELLTSEQLDVRDLDSRENNLETLKNHKLRQFLLQHGFSVQQILRITFPLNRCLKNDNAREIISTGITSFQITPINVLQFTSLQQEIIKNTALCQTVLSHGGTITQLLGLSLTQAINLENPAVQNLVNNGRLTLEEAIFLPFTQNPNPQFRSDIRRQVRSNSDQITMTSYSFFNQLLETDAQAITRQIYNSAA